MSFSIVIVIVIGETADRITTKKNPSYRTVASMDVCVGFPRFENVVGGAEEDCDCLDCVGGVEGGGRGGGKEMSG